jgi:hypothetical protein
MKNYYYGFRLQDGPRTTTGYPGTNGRLDIAGWITVFRSKKERDAWAHASNKNISCSKRELKKFRRGTCWAGIEEEIESFLNQ